MRGGVEALKAGRFCFSKVFHLFHPKCITVIDFLVKSKPKRVKVELGTGDGMPDPAKTGTARGRGNPWPPVPHTTVKLRGQMVLWLWPVQMCPRVCESTV